MNHAKSLFLVSRSNRSYLPVLMGVIGLNSVFNLLSLVSIFPLVELVVLDSGGGEAANDGASLTHSRVSRSVQEVLDWLGLSTDLTSISLLIIGIFVVKTILGTLTTYSTHSYAEKVRCFWVDVVCRRYFYSSYRAVAQQSTGVIANNIIREPTQAGRYVKACLTYANSLLLSLAIVAGMLYVEWRFVAAFFGCLVLIYPILKYTLFERSAAYGKRSIKLSQEIVGLTAEKATNIKQIHILGIEEYSRARVLKVMRRLSKVFVRYQTIKELPRNVVELFVVSLGLSMLLIVDNFYPGGLRSILPSLIFFGVALSRLSSMFANLVSLHVTCANQAPSVDILLALADSGQFSQNGEPKDGATPFEGIRSDIVLSGLNFAYDPQAPVLSDLSCTIPHRKLTCFVGPSGSGKSTLMDLLIRLYDPDRGSISCNGHNVRQYRLADWRRSIGYISQDASTFSVSIRENIILGRTDVTDERLNELASTLHLDRLIDSLEHGWDTEIGKDGVSLSGGERKRVAIARALLSEPDLLIFDEATVSFQEGLELELLASIRTAKPNISIVVITHRISTMDIADLVHVLDHGTVVASGSAAEVHGTAQSLLVEPKEERRKDENVGLEVNLGLEAN